MLTPWTPDLIAPVAVPFTPAAAHASDDSLRLSEMCAYAGIAFGGDTSPQGAAQPCVCKVVDEWMGHALVLRVSGELDLFTAPRFRMALDHYLGVAGDLVVLDLAEVTFLGAFGLGMFLEFKVDLARQGACRGSSAALWISAYPRRCGNSCCAMPRSARA